MMNTSDAAMTTLSAPPTGRRGMTEIEKTLAFNQVGCMMVFVYEVVWRDTYFSAMGMRL